MNPFLYRRKPLQRDETEGVEGGGPPSPVFITSAALLSFPVAAGVVKLIWAVYENLISSSPQKPVMFISALIVGSIIFLMNVKEPATRPRNATEWIIASFVAFINAIFLYAAAYGLNLNVLGLGKS